MDRTVLVLGGRGRLGQALVQAFAAAGWQVRAQMRPGGSAPRGLAMPGVQWMAVDGTDPVALRQAAGDAQVVVHAMNPPYTAAQWRAQAPLLMRSAINVSLALGALLLFPGNVYNFGAGMPSLLTPDTPQRPTSEKGRIRVALEQQLAQAAQERGLQAVVLRAGDFFGAGSDSWLDRVIAKKLPQGRVTWPGPLDVPTAWAWLPDLAQTFVRVAETAHLDRRGGVENLHFPGLAVTGQDWLAALTEIAREQGWLPAAGRLHVDTLPWGVMRVASPFVPMLASLQEMRYLWQTPHALDGTALARRIGEVPRTPLLYAVRSALEASGMACKPVPDRNAHRVLTQGA